MNAIASDLIERDRLTQTEEGAAPGCTQGLVELGAVTETKGTVFGGKMDVGNGFQSW